LTYERKYAVRHQAPAQYEVYAIATGRTHIQLGYSTEDERGAAAAKANAYRNDLNSGALSVKDVRAEVNSTKRTHRARIRQVGGDDGYQWCLIIDGIARYSGMTRSEAEWRRRRFIDTGEM